MEQSIELKQMLETQQKILSVVLDVQEKQIASEKRLEKLENLLSKLMDSLDTTVVLINRHEAEIAAMHDNYRRLEQRIESLELKLAH